VTSSRNTLFSWSSKALRIVEAADSTLKPCASQQQLNQRGMASFKALLALCAVLALAPLARAQTCSASQGKLK